MTILSTIIYSIAFASAILFSAWYVGYPNGIWFLGIGCLIGVAEVLKGIRIEKGGQQ